MLPPCYKEQQELGEKGMTEHSYINPQWLYGTEFIQGSEESRYSLKTETQGQDV